MRAVRVLIPAFILLLWLGGAALGGPLFGRVDEVTSNDRTAYLPDSAESTQVDRLQSAFTDSRAIPAVVVIVAEQGPLSQAELDGIDTAIAAAQQIPGLEEGSPPIQADDGAAVQLFLPISTDADVADTVTELERVLDTELPPGLRAYVTGPAGFSADLAAAFSGIDGLLLGVAVLAVLAILLLVYRSALLPIVVLATSLFALCVALLVIWSLARSGVLLLSGQTQGILFILVIGAATDYSLLYVARYREELRAHERPLTATLRAWRGTLEPVAASGGTVIAGLLCLLLSDLKSNSALGPVAAIGIVVAMLAALSLLPAALLLLGRSAFWPRRPRFEPDAVAAEGGLPSRGIWSTVAALVRRRPRQIWLVTAVLLAAAAAFTVQLQASGVAQSELVLGDSQARAGQTVLGEHFPGGSGSPVLAITEQSQLQQAVEVLLDDERIDAVTVTAADSPSGQAPVTRDGVGAVGPPGTPPATPTVVDGQVLLQATLSVPADGEAAQQTVRELRAALDEAAPGTLVGGVTAIALDTNDASIHDRALIIPIVLAVILFILMLLLRAVLAPLLLIATTALSFGSALGVSALVFNHLLGFPGADPAVPLYGFVFLVALGIDYNIFLMTRVREESLQHGTRSGITRGLSITGGVITSAGIVLAATFAALAVIPILFLVQLAFIVAFGVLLDTFVVRTLLVPALALDIGPRIWWPLRLAADAGSRGEPGGGRPGPQHAATVQTGRR